MLVLLTHIGSLRSWCPSNQAIGTGAACSSLALESSSSWDNQSMCQKAVAWSGLSGEAGLQKIVKPWV